MKILKKILFKIFKTIALMGVLSYGGIFFARQIREIEKEADKKIKCL